MNMNWPVLILTHEDSRNAITWLFNNVNRSNWVVSAATNGLEFRFNNEADATWFALIHAK